MTSIYPTIEDPIAKRKRESDSIAKRDLTLLPFAWRFTSRQPIDSGATTSAGRSKKERGRCWEGVVAAGVALGMGENY